MKDTVRYLMDRARETTEVPNYLLWGGGICFIYASIYTMSNAIGSFYAAQQLGELSDPLTAVGSLFATAALALSVFCSSRWAKTHSEK